MKKIKKSRKWKLLKEAITENIIIDREFFLRFLFIAYTAGYITMIANPCVNAIKNFIVNYQRREAAKEVDIEELEKSFEDCIVCGSFNIDFNQPYRIDECVLVDDKGNKVDLTNEERILILVLTKLDSQTFKKSNLRASKIKGIMLDRSSITDDFVTELPYTLEELSINQCGFITDLSLLPMYCPNLKRLDASGMIKLSNLDFVYSLNNLEYIKLCDSLAVTPELIEYCENKGITIELNGNEIKNSAKIDKIIDEIITPDMSDKEKINTVCHYVIDSIKYDIFLSSESNDNPIDMALSGKGVCISYAYLTTALLNRIDINAYNVLGDGHAWNLVELDGEYFYIDPSNIDGSILNPLLYKIFSVSPFYMINPNDAYLTCMKVPKSDKALIPRELVEEIINGSDEQTLIKKYGASVGNVTIILLFIAMSILAFFSISITTDSILEVFNVLDDIYDTYEYSKLMEEKKKSSKKKKNKTLKRKSF